MRLHRQRAGRARISVALSGIAAMVATGSAVAVAASAGTPPTPTPTVATQPTESVDAADLQAFALFNRPLTTADAVPTVEAQGLGGTSFATSFGGNVALARRAPGFATGGAWLVPGAGAVCLIADPWYTSASMNESAGGGAAACAVDSRAASGALELTAEGEKHPGMTTVAGVVPNGVSAVTVTLVDGSTVREPVYENVYMGIVSATVQLIQYTAEDGARVTVQT